MSRRRIASASPPREVDYFSQDPNSPYLHGRKNQRFLHPSLHSSSVFYDFDYGYLNDMPNERLLSPVKNDKFAKKTIKEPSQDEYYLPEPRSQTQERKPDLSGDLIRPHSTRYQKRVAFEDEVRRETGNRTAMEEVQRKNNEVEMRDDRSQTSSVLSGQEYVCAKCFNRHMIDGKRRMCTAEKQKERDQERRITEKYRQQSEEEEARRRMERAQRTSEAKEVKEKLDNEYYERLERRRSPKKESTTALDKIFDKQEEMNKKRWALSQMFGSHIKEQVQNKYEEKRIERNLNSQFYATSLDVGTGYRNKYLDDPDSVRYTLKQQIEEREARQRREQEMEKKLAREKNEEAMRSLEEEDRRRKEREGEQRREFQKAFVMHDEEKRAKQQEAVRNKRTERQAVDQEYVRYKKRQEEEAKAKRQLFDFKQCLLDQKEKMSYRKQYEERKNQKEATSFDPVTRQKKLYPCGECSNLYEKGYLTKLN